MPYYITISNNISKGALSYINMMLSKYFTPSFLHLCLNILYHKWSSTFLKVSHRWYSIRQLNSIWKSFICHFTINNCLNETKNLKSGYTIYSNTLYVIFFVKCILEAEWLWKVVFLKSYYFQAFTFVVYFKKWFDIKEKCFHINIFFKYFESVGVI